MAGWSAIDLVLLGGLLLAAAVIRIPYLQFVPIITDESFEVLAALPISHGHLQLQGPVSSAGAVITYLFALLFRLFGPSVDLPRQVIMAIGVLTVGATYLLGRSMGGRKAGFIAAALLACSPVHTVVNSHVAWSNSATPLFTTLLFTTLHAALKHDDGRRLVLGGFLYGLALQTHVSVAVILPGIVLWFLARKDILRWLRRPWPYLAVGAALLGYGNMIAYGLTASGWIGNLQNRGYAWVSQPTWSQYWTNLSAMVKAVALTLGGQIPRFESPSGDIVATASLLVWFVLALLYAIRRRETLPVLVLLCTMLVMPYFNKQYEGLLLQRYTTFLLPLAFATMGLAASRLVDLWHEAGWPHPRAAAAAVTGLVLLLAIYPVRTTFAYYASETESERDNALALALTATLRHTLPPGTPVYLSSDLRGPGVRADGGFRYLRSLYYYLSLEQLNSWVLDPPDLVGRLESQPRQESWLLLTAANYETLARDFTLEPVPNSPPVLNGGVLVRYVGESSSP